MQLIFGFLSGRLLDRDYCLAEGVRPSGARIISACTLEDKVAITTRSIILAKLTKTKR